ncbi:PH domain-containing protein [Candidatus Pacearchaeota archaeon]|nr:PH domain-containing protein [Candidatus Pacearchaeota archaeon]
MTIKDDLQTGEKIELQVHPSPWSYFWKYILGWFLFVVGLFIFEWSRRSTNYSVTNKRIIYEYTFMSRKMTSINYSNIRDIHLRQSFTQRIFNIGDIYIDTSGSSGTEMVIKGIKNPREFKRKIGLHHK